VNESNFPLNGFLQVNNTAQNIISFAIQTIEFVLREVVLVILRVALPLSLALFLFGLLLYFTHLNRRMGRDFIVLSLILILISQLIQL
jgi:hypothetical protein